MEKHQTLETQTTGSSADTSEGQQFEGRWRVLANSMVRQNSTNDIYRQEVAVIERDTQSRGGFFYKLYCEVTENEIVSREFLQSLEYHRESGMLGHLRGQRERCLAFWDLGHTRCIFGMRRKTVGPADVGLYPWERTDDDGTWGAELEPPVEEEG